MIGGQWWWCFGQAVVVVLWAHDTPNLWLTEEGSGLAPWQQPAAVVASAACVSGTEVGVAGTAESDGATGQPAGY